MPANYNDPISSLTSTTNNAQNANIIKNPKKLPQKQCINDNKDLTSKSSEKTTHVLRRHNAANNQQDNFFKQQFQDKNRKIPAPPYQLEDPNQQPQSFSKSYNTVV